MIQIPVLLFKIGVDVPRVPLLGFVPESLQEISAYGLRGPSRVGFRGCQRLGIAAFIKEAGHAPGCGSSFSRTRSFSSAAPEAFSSDCPVACFAAPRT